jgi:threonine dehydrogenase-like Zn-dependent dehydrogenase
VAQNVLADGGEVGFEHAGGYGQFLLTEAGNVRVLPDGFPMDQAALIEPLAVCVRAMGRLRMERAESALVLGDGAIGLLMLALLKRAGVRTVLLVGGRPARLAAAQEFGADSVINYHEAGSSLGESIARVHGHPFANVVEASGSPLAMTLAVGAAGKEGKVLVIGDYGAGRADFAWNDLLHRELELIGSNASAGAWDEAVALATGGGVPLGRLISRRLPVTEYSRGIDLVRGDRNVLKILLDWREERA